MSSKKSFVIAGVEMSKTRAIEVAREVIHSAVVGQVLEGESNLVAKSFYKLKGGHKDDAIFKVDNFGGNRCFFYSHNNGETWIDFSFMKSLSPRENVIKERATCAFRHEVDYQIAGFRKKGMHVDHIIPFHVLLSDFLNGKKMKIDEVGTVEIAAKFTTRILIDRNLAEEWQEYHLKHAKLRLITPVENRRKGWCEDLALYRYRKSIGQTYDR